ncbi:MAG TPA: cell wall hydrolase [Sphingobium sp.]|nr:cell wall hydrolase [Sphingobium sp.]
MAQGPLPSPPRASLWSTVLWVLLLAGIPALVAHLSIPSGAPARQIATSRVVEAARQPPSPPPPVEPVEVMAVAPTTARAINAAVPFSQDPNPAARPFRLAAEGDLRERAIDCLAAAQYYEAGDDPGGQRAVAQVVLNRLRHPAFPKSICAVVFQGSERASGCQFTFTCDGSLARMPSAAAWTRARALAARMLSGGIDARVGHATHYHTDWVVPYWSQSLDKVTAVDTHLFFRWKGWWGTPPAFRRGREETEPVIAKLAAVSPMHRANAATVGVAAGSAPSTPTAPDFSDLSRPAMAIGRDRIGERFGPGRLAAINSTGDAFVMLLDGHADPASFEALARQICTGRARCRMLGWTRIRDVPSGFPIDEETLRSMSYAYMRSAEAGLERSLYNCAEFTDQPGSRCMRDRAPAAPRRGTETIRLSSP